MNTQSATLKLKAAWKALSARERWMLSSAAIVVICTLFYVLLLAPLLNANDTMLRNIQGLRSDLVWLREQVDAGVERSTTGEVVQDRDQTLTTVIERTARAFGLDSTIVQLTPSDNEDQVQVVLETADFSRWLRWVSNLDERYGVRLENATIERLDDPDTADARLLFVR